MSDTNDIRRDFEAWCETFGAGMLTDKDDEAKLARLAAWSAWQVAAERAAASQWQPIETAPMHKIVLVNVVGSGVTSGSRIGSCGWSWEELDDEPADSIVSHWMPFPPAIRQGGANQSKINTQESRT